MSYKLVIFVIVIAVIGYSSLKNKYSTYTSEEKLFAVVRKLSIYNHKDNLDGYKRLYEINPIDKYKKKIEFYEKVSADPVGWRIKRCVGRGVLYYKEIGSYPSLSTGESALMASSRKCNNTYRAFDN